MSFAPSPARRRWPSGVYYLLMYKTAVYTLVNVVITHQKQQISKKWYYAAWHCVSVNVLLSNITFLYLLLWQLIMIMRIFTRRACG